MIPLALDTWSLVAGLGEGVGVPAKPWKSKPDRMGQNVRTPQKLRSEYLRANTRPEETRMQGALDELAPRPYLSMVNTHEWRPSDTCIDPMPQLAKPPNT